MRASERVEPLSSASRPQQRSCREGSPSFRICSACSRGGTAWQGFSERTASRAAENAKRARTDGSAASDMVRSKRSKYPQAKSPTTPMVPFVVEALGRLSPEAHGLLATIAPADKKVRSQVLRTAKQTLSVLVQTGLAELLLSAEPGRGLTGLLARAGLHWPLGRAHWHLGRPGRGLTGLGQGRAHWPVAGLTGLLALMYIYPFDFIKLFWIFFPFWCIVGAGFAARLPCSF